MSEHSPGPWKWARDEMENRTPDRINDADGRCVVEVTFVPREPIRSMLTAAPEMLELLRVVQNDLEDDGRWPRWRDKLEALLAKFPR